MNKIFTRFKMDMQGIDTGSVLCPICCLDDEKVNHFFFSFGMAMDLWSLLSRMWELDLHVFSSISE